MNRSALLASALLFSVLAAPLRAQQAPKVTILGASLSHGMDLGEETKRRGAGALLAGIPEHRKSTIGLGALLAKVLAVPPVDHSDLYLFAAPRERALRQVTQTIAEQPTLVIAIDLVFWFGYWPDVTGLPKGEAESDLLQAYGNTDKEIDKALRSLEKQTVAFTLLDELLAKTKATIVIADYPDMFGANPMMLHPKHIPLRRTLDELNTRLAAFVKTRPRLLVYPLADYVKRAKLGQVELPGERGVVVTTESAIQADNLHPTRLGTAIVLHDLYGFLAERLGEDMPRQLGERPSFATLIEKAGAQKDLEIARAAGQAQPASRPGKQEAGAGK